MNAPHLRALAGLAPFRSLLRIRLVGQVSDGLLQAGLVGVVLFAPERAPSPTRIALGFAVLLLPFCLVAPLWRACCSTDGRGCGCWPGPTSRAPC